MTLSHALPIDRHLFDLIKARHPVPVHWRILDQRFGPAWHDAADALEEDGLIEYTGTQYRLAQGETQEDTLTRHLRAHGSVHEALLFRRFPWARMRIPQMVADGKVCRGQIGDLTFYYAAN